MADRQLRCAATEVERIGRVDDDLSFEVGRIGELDRVFGRAERLRGFRCNQEKDEGA